MEIESQTQGPTETNTDDAAQVTSNVETTQSNDASETSEQIETEPNLKDRIQKRGRDAGQKSDDKKEADKPEGQHNHDAKPADHQEPPKFEPNFKYKAFGKEKELDEFWRGLVKDADSEKKVKDVFTRADAFDDMKQRYEGASRQMQEISQQHQELDKDVKRVMHFRNAGDYDNFFAALQIPKQEMYNWVARQLELEKASPEQQDQYKAGVQARAENLYNQQNYASIQAQFAEQRAQMVQMQLDHNLSRPELASTASAWDRKMGDGSFRRLVIDEAAAHTNATQGREIWTPEQAISHVMNKFGKLLETPQPQATAQAPQGQPYQAPVAPQAPQVVQVQGKPVIPNVNGRGTSPVKQAPKSLQELREMGTQLRMQEFNAHS